MLPLVSRFAVRFDQHTIKAESGNEKGAWPKLKARCMNGTAHEIHHDHAARYCGCEAAGTRSCHTLTAATRPNDCNIQAAPVLTTSKISVSVGADIAPPQKAIQRLNLNPARSIIGSSTINLFLRSRFFFLELKAWGDL